MNLAEQLATLLEQGHPQPRHLEVAAAELRWLRAEVNRLHEERFREAAEQQLEIERLAKEVERLKTVPMRYRRMAFNAELQEENSRLRAELDRWHAELSAVMPADFKDWASIPERPQLAAWVIKNLRERLAETEGVTVADPMDWPLPCDVRVGHGTHSKGASLRSLVARMQVLYNMAQAAAAPQPPAQAPTNEQIREALLACGYKIKPGLDDLMPYVYEGARAVLALQRALSATQPPGEGR